MARLQKYVDSCQCGRLGSSSLDDLEYGSDGVKQKLKFYPERAQLQKFNAVLPDSEGQKGFKGNY